MAAPRATLGWAEPAADRFGPGRSAPATGSPTTERAWLVFGVGPGGGGLYSYDRLENLFGLGFHSADRIIPNDRPSPSEARCGWGPETPRCRCGTRSSTSSRPQTLVLGPHGDRNEAVEQGLPWPTWAFVLRDLGMGTTRLLVRMRGDFKATLVGLLANEYGLEPVHFVMERKLLLESCCSTASTAPNRHPPDRW